MQGRTLLLIHLKKIGTLRAKDLRKNVSIFQVGGSTPAPPTPPVLSRTVYWKKSQNKSACMSDYSGPQSKFLIGKLLLQFLTYFLINFVSKKTHSKSYLCPIHLSLFLTSMKSSNCPYFKLAHATQQYCFKTQNQGYCSVWRNLDSFFFLKKMPLYF